MSKRTSMRPVTLKRIIEICNIVATHDVLDENLIIQGLDTSRDRARELLLEVNRMRLIDKKEETFVANGNTYAFLEEFEKENWSAFHQYFLKNYIFYQQFITLLRLHIDDIKGLTIDDMIKEANKREMKLNRTSIEVLQNWCERLRILQRHLYSKRFYLILEGEPDLKTFKISLLSCYHSLNTMRRPNLRLTYIEIPRIREEVCELLKISRETFDRLFKRVYFDSIGRIELSGAPTTTSAKRSPLSIRTMKASKKEDILSPRIDLTKERKGITMGNKSYYYVAIHRRL